MQMSKFVPLVLVLAVVGGPAFAAGNSEKGKKVFNKCGICHITAATGAKKLGPPLAGIFGRKAGSLEGYKYSNDFKAAGEKGLVWTEETFLAYMENTKAFIGSFIGKKSASTKMVFSGLKTKAERDDLLAYLKEATK